LRILEHSVDFASTEIFRVLSDDRHERLCTRLYVSPQPLPVFRRWGKRFFVVVDEPFFTALPKIRRVEGKQNSEITWLVYQLNRNASGIGYSLSDPEVIFTLWDDVLTALREGEAPQQSDVLAEIATRIPQLKTYET
jgi:restriction endonuclease NotI